MKKFQKNTLVMLTAAGLGISACGAENLIKNGDFETDDLSGFSIVRLNAKTYGDASATSSEKFTEQKFTSGKRALEINGTARTDSHNLRMMKLKTEPGKAYLLTYSVFIEQESAGYVSGIISFTDADTKKEMANAYYYLKNIREKGSWQNIKFRFRVPKKAADTTVKILTNGIIKCYVDNISLTEVK